MTNILALFCLCTCEGFSSSSVFLDLENLQEFQDVLKTPTGFHPSSSHSSHFWMNIQMHELSSLPQLKHFILTCWFSFNHSGINILITISYKSSVRYYLLDNKKLLVTWAFATWGTWPCRRLTHIHHFSHSCKKQAFYIYFKHKIYTKYPSTCSLIKANPKTAAVPEDVPSPTHMPRPSSGPQEAM